MRARTVFAVSTCALLALPLAGRAQPADVSSTASSSMASRLLAERLGNIQPGTYAAADGRAFSLNPYRGGYLLRFTDSPEHFALKVEHVSMGARLLKYDTGATALRVSVWGGLTIYTTAAPGGLPATRQEASEAEQQQSTAGADSLLVPVSAPDLTAALQDEGRHFSYVSQLKLKFEADPAIMDSPEARSLAFDTLGVTALGIERFTAASPAAARQAIARKIDTVRIEPGNRPQVALNKKVLVVSFVPGDGVAGRASSHATARALGKLVGVAYE